MKFEFVPWTNFADRMLNELNSKGKLCDLIIGDSQWIGGAAENGHYVKLNDFFAKEGIKMDDFMPATVVGYSEWPKNTPNYWALPAMGDALGWTYRKDWFSQARAPGRVQEEVRPRPRAAEDARRAEADRRVLPGPRDRRQEGLWRRDLHRARLGRHHHGRVERPLPLRLRVPGSQEALFDGRLRQLRRRREGPGVLQGAVRLLHAARLLQRLHAGRPRRLQVRPGRDADELFAFFPGLYKDPNVGGDKIGFFVNPGEKVHASQLGGQGISVVSYSPNQDEALQYIKWFASADDAEEVVVARRLFLRQGGAERSGLPADAPFAADFLDSMGEVKDFWAEPSYAQLLLAEQKRVHDYVVADKGTAKEALDELVKDWEDVFKDDGKI